MPFFAFCDPLQHASSRQAKRRNEDMRALKSVKEAAELLGISKWTVRSYIRDGKLTPIKLGRRVLVEEAELERIVAEAKARAVAQVHQPQEGRLGL